MPGMKTLHLILLWILAAPFAVAEDDTKKDVMTVEYSSIGPYPTHGITMAGALKALGVSLEQIDYLKLVGDESSMTTGLSRKVEIDEWFWDRYFETAEPYKYWVASGNRRLEIYLKGEAKPKTTIYINETDGCTAEGDKRELRYMCHGLHDWFMANLDPEPNKAQQGVAPQSATRSESDSEGGDKPQPESEPRPR